MNQKPVKLIDRIVDSCVDKYWHFVFLFVTGIAVGAFMQSLFNADIHIVNKYRSESVRAGVAEYYVGEDNKLKFRYLTDKRDLE